MCRGFLSCFSIFPATSSLSLNSSSTTMLLYLSNTQYTACFYSTPSVLSNSLAFDLLCLVVGVPFSSNFFSSGVPFVGEWACFNSE
eukprot:m.254810 g.254810  ORF g.254810 m.254810 type:complete len:86 (+) comp54540_c0_seq1:127-384(+)